MFCVYRMRYKRMFASYKKTGIEENVTSNDKWHTYVCMNIAYISEIRRTLEPICILVPELLNLIKENAKSYFSLNTVYTSISCIKLAILDWISLLLVNILPPFFFCEF